MAATKAAAPAKPRQPVKAKTFRIVFWIEGAPYSVLPLKPDTGVAVKAFRLTRRDARGRVRSCYDVSLSPEGHVACECKGWLRWLKPCKHIRCLVAAGMFPPLPAPANKPVAQQEAPAIPEPEGGADAQEAA
jgi:hypothetical protein